MIRIIISPAKKMNIAEDGPVALTRPIFLDRAILLRNILKEMTFEELKALWNCNEKIARQNQERLHTLDPEHNLTAAVLSYEGIQYQYLAPQVFSDTEWEYITKHLRILSGLYGILRPTDGVIPYRLEMQARLATSAGKNLYDFWGNTIYEALTEHVSSGESAMADAAPEQSIQILNLASAEYSKVILPTKENRPITCITCIFGELIDGRVKTKGTLAKMARGEMVRWMAEHQIEDPEEIKNFDRLNYRFVPELSDPENFVYIREQPGREILIP